MLNKKIKTFNGTVLGIGLSEQMLSILEKNDNITECFYLDCDNNNNNDSNGYTKTINIRKIKKIFRKKSFDYIVCNFEKMKPYLKSFVKNSIYLNRKELYFYNIQDFELEEIKRRYQRYGSIFEEKKEFVLISNQKAKTNMLKNAYYYICDLIYDVIDYIGNLFVN